ncbi:short-chain dehydrogenase/reductase SDR [Advenella kashmirensis WT001]|uniref:Short-chain dehydrogenase/reductase SDR n=1 Tax=Advenella kashmirensis (strain DSM 17095 / LMG 22695 / WT001) TaxID=1036672 RepID=I3UGM3_ADVKW|nr:SDR family oxidoreductase [Advenella kashmirensis]AFK64161.1 short-chain dehydrogenase/reductase SDR [Advenella kashmirensis WT001]
MSELFNLNGKTALVTGSSRGLGFAFAQALAEHGADVILNGTRLDRLEQAAQLLADRGFRADTLAFDVADEHAVVAAFDSLDRQNRQVDILINNAGIQLRKPLTELAVAEWHSVLDTNLTSAFLVGREAAKRMIARGKGGKIINIGSLTSECARATIAPYTVSKGGIKMLTRAMTAEWAAHNIQINAIGPGYMATDMNEALLSNPQFDGWVKSRTPAGRWGLPEELAGAAVFLASRASDYVNGQIIYVDGGMLAVL